MAILNYTTEVTTDKTIAQIQRMLVNAKAEAVLSEYQDGVLSALSFRIQTPHGLLMYRLPANTQKIYQVMVRDRSIRAGMRTREQAARVAWRIVKDWLEAQLAIVSADMADLAQVFLPYMQVTPSGETLYEALKDRQFNTAPLLTDKRTNDGNIIVLQKSATP